jgi:integrase
VPRDKHQNGWVVESGKRAKKWIGHWCPYRQDGTRSHSTVVLGLKSKMRRWEAEDALRKHIESATGQRAKCDGDPTLQWFWENAYLPSRTWGPAMISTVTSIAVRHILPRFGQTRISELDKLELQKHVNALAESFSRSLVKKTLVQYRAIGEEAVERGLIDKNPARKLAMPPTRKPCGRFLALEEFDAQMAQLEFRDRLITRMFCTMGFRPGELFALRWNDIEPGRIRVDESTSRWGLKEPKTAGSDTYLPMPAGVQLEMDLWREMHRTAPPSSLVFPTDRGTAISAHNYERDVIVPAAIRAGIMAKPAKQRQKGDPKRNKATAVNFQAFRRTFATWMQRTGATVKDVQGAMRHSSPDQTLKAYMREIPAGVRAAVDALDRIFAEHGGLAETKPQGPVQ